MSHTCVGSTKLKRIVIAIGIAVEGGLHWPLWREGECEADPGKDGFEQGVAVSNGAEERCGERSEAVADDECSTEIRGSQLLMHIEVVESIYLMIW